MTGKIGAAMGIEAQREAVARLIAAEGLGVLAERITLRSNNNETSIPGEFRP